MTHYDEQYAIIMQFMSSVLIYSQLWEHFLLIWDGLNYDIYFSVLTLITIYINDIITGYWVIN